MSNVIATPPAPTTELNLDVIGRQFLAFNGLTQYKMMLIEQAVKPFVRLHRRQIVITTPTINPAGLRLDFYLGRLFLMCQQVTNRTRWNRWRIILWYAGPWLFYLYWMVLVANILLMVVFTNQRTSVLVHTTYQVSLLAVIVLIKWGFSLQLIAGVMCKNDIEHHYERILTAFFDQHHPDLFACLHSSRQFSRLIKFNFRIGMKWLFQLHPRPLGPFSMI